MWSHQGIWDWAATAMMMVGFTILFALAIGLALALTVRMRDLPPDDTYDEQPVAGRIAYDEETLRLLAS